MKRYKDIGIIFKQYNINESDKIIHILTKYNGRVESIAKGVRKITSRKAGSLDIANLSKFYLATGRNLDIITDVKLINDFSDLKNKLNSTFIIFYICELIDKFSVTGEYEKEIFDLTLELFNQLILKIDTIFIRSFEIKLLSLKGYEPNMNTCINCSKPFTDKDMLYLSNISPGFICDCKRGKISQMEHISHKSVKTLKYLLSNSIRKAGKIMMDSVLKKELNSITTVWIESVLEKPIQSKKFI